MVQKKNRKNILCSTKVFNTIYNVILTISMPDRVIQQVNNSLVEFLGYNPNELVNQNIRFFFLSEKSYQEFGEELQKALAEKKPFIKSELLLKRKDGSTVFCDVYLTPLHKTERSNRTVIFLQDIIAKNRMTNNRILALEKEENHRLKTSLLQNLSHEIRTPMNGIIGFIQLLMTGTKDTETVVQYLDIIEKSKERLINLINDLVNLSKIEAGLMSIVNEDFELNGLLDELHHTFLCQAEAKSLKFDIEKETYSSGCRIISDKTKVRQILSNLINNAIKFTETGSVSLGSSIDNGIVSFYIKDTGVGIPMDKQNVIFEPFSQVDSSNRGYEGAGLGLSISKAFVEMLGGKIWLKSECGKGSTFFISIPSNGENLAVTPAFDEIFIGEELPPKSNLKILIAEDDTTSALLIETILKPLSREILKASNGYEVVKMCHENSDLDIILMDIKMPIIDGISATKVIRSFNNDVIIIAQTASAFSSDKERAIESGCNDYIAKPIDRSELFRVIRKHHLE